MEWWRTLGITQVRAWQQNMFAKAYTIALIHARAFSRKGTEAPGLTVWSGV
jgi:hypothetical protein